ncbi:MAG: hypothetical protein U1F39_07425 [Steroidobacteraceae bacterium]
MSADHATRLNTEPADTAQMFVINLCASTSPMALSHPNTPELKRFTFFVSRQREEGRERFRLHMGYFATQEQAEALLAAVRDVYPAAWAGPAPTTGVPRRARTSIAPTVTVTRTAAQPAAPPVAVAPTVATVAPPVATVAPAAVAAPPTLDSMSNVRDVLAQLSEDSPQDLSASQTLRVLEVAPEPAVAPKVVAPKAPPAMEIPRAAPAAAMPPAAAVLPAAPAPAAAVPVAKPRAPLKARPPAPAKDGDENQVRIVTPEDTQTLTDIRLDAQNNAPPCFAVQLVWAVAPIDVSSLPHLAIFDAYTLYNVEGSRQGRKWFGLRLGFFSDPNSATQVAHYVRADYPAVAVVPVATRERDHAKDGGSPAQRAPEVAPPMRPENTLSIEQEGLDGFELLQDDAPRAAKRDVEDIAPRTATPAASAAASMTARQKIAAAAAGRPLVKPAAPAAGAAGATAVKESGKPAGKRVMVRKRPQAAGSGRAAPGAPNPLESTLEILGASTLTLDESREIVNDSAIRKPIEKKSASRFSKLLNRLSGG